MLHHIANAITYCSMRLDWYWLFEQGGGLELYADERAARH